MSSQETRKHFFKDGLVILSIMKDLKINEYHPQILNNLLELNYRYTTQLLDDAKTLSQYANKKTIDMDDVMLANKMSNDRLLLSTPNNVLIASSKDLNKIPLPLLKDSKGLRIPTDGSSFLQTNYNLKNSGKEKFMTTTTSTTTRTKKKQNNKMYNCMETQMNDNFYGEIEECDPN